MMPSQISGYIRQAVRKPEDKLNILTFPTHERYETGLCKTGHNFYAFHGQGIKTWNKNYAPVPKNYTLFDGNQPESSQIPPDIDFDLVLSQSRHAHYNVGRQLATHLNIPLVTLEHCVPGGEWAARMVEQCKPMTGDIDVYISDYSVNAWQVQDREDKNVVIYHGIDTDLFKQSTEYKEYDLLTVCNDMPGRPMEVGWGLWQQAVQLLDKDNIKTHLVGDNKGISKAAKDVDELVSYYNRSKIFFNTTLVSTYPTTMLEAMACGLPVITTSTCAIPNIIQHGINGFLIDSPEDVPTYTKILLQDDSLMNSMSEAAKKTINDMFNMDRFVQQWDETLRRAANLCPER